MDLSVADFRPGTSNRLIELGRKDAEAALKKARLWKKARK